MIEINNKKICESCFCEICGEEICPHCGFDKSEYTADPTVLPMGTKLNDKIIIGRVMGKGGFGITYLGYDLRMDKIIAVKEYYPNGISYRAHMGTELSVIDTKSAETFEQGAQKFYTEAEMVSQFNGNPNIMGVYDYFRTNNTVYLVMEYLSGMTLKNYVKRHGKLSDGQALYVMDKIAAALSITHSAGVLHRDISPDNIMICADGKVKLIDFGAARQILTESSSNLTVVMKQGYTPIEQYTKKGMQGAWTDIYSLGVSMYYALTGVVLDDPYSRMDGDSEFDENKHGINDSIWEILKKCTMINASDRYGSAIDLRKALKSVSAPLTADAIRLTEEDLKQQSQGDIEDAQTELNSEEAAASEPVDNPTAAEEIEIFEGEKESPDKSEKSCETDSKDDDKIQPKGGKRSDGGKKTVPIICACAGLAAAAVLCFVFIPNAEKAPPDIPAVNTTISDKSTVTTSKEVTQETAYTEDHPEMNAGKLYLELDTKYPGDGQSGKNISKTDLIKFDGDVKVTLHFEYVENQPNEYGLIEFRDLNFRKVDIMAFNYGIKCEISEGNWYDILPGMEFFSFVISRETINNMIGSLKLRVTNLIVKSAVLEAYDPSEYEPGEDALTVSIDSREYCHGSNFIPKWALESFGSDVRVALDIEYESMDPKKEDIYININVCDENWNSVDVTAYNIVTNPPELEAPQYTIGFRDTPDIFTFTITKEQISALTDNGLMFNSSNVYIKSAALEAAETYDYFVPVSETPAEISEPGTEENEIETSSEAVSDTDVSQSETENKTISETTEAISKTTEAISQTTEAISQTTSQTTEAIFETSTEETETSSDAVSDTDISESDTEDETTSIIDGKLYLELDTEYPGDCQAGKEISKTDFLRFDGDVKVTLHFEFFESIPDEYGTGIIAFTDLNSNRVNVMAFNNGVGGEDPEEEYWYLVFPGMEFFSFVVSRDAISDMIASLHLRVGNLIVKSAVLEKYDPSAYEPGEDALIVNIDSRVSWNGSNFIPKSVLESFGSDVRVTLDIEYENMDNNDISIVVCDENNYNGIEVTAENIVNNPFVKEVVYSLGSRVVPDIFTFTITKEQIARLTDKGLTFNGGNVYIKSAALEAAK